MSQLLAVFRAASLTCLIFFMSIFQLTVLRGLMKVAFWFLDFGGICFLAAAHASSVLGLDFGGQSRN